MYTTHFKIIEIFLIEVKCRQTFRPNPAKEEMEGKRDSLSHTTPFLMGWVEKTEWHFKTKVFLDREHSIHLHMTLMPLVIEVVKSMFDNIR